VVLWLRFWIQCDYKVLLLLWKVESALLKADRLWQMASHQTVTFFRRSLFQFQKVNSAFLKTVSIKTRKEAKEV